MAKKSAVIEKKEVLPLFENPSPHLNRFSVENIWGEVPGDKLIVHWDESLHRSLNYLDEDLYIQIFDKSGENLVKEERINYLAEKEVDVDSGQEYLLKVVTKEKFHISVATEDEISPKVTFIQESINRYMLAWGQLEWNYIKGEVTREHHVNWDYDIEVVLKINRWEAEEGLPKEEWRFPGMNDMEIVCGKIKDISLIVVHKETKIQLKEIFNLTLLPGKVKKVLHEVPFSTPQIKPYFYLYREVRETDTNHLRLKWDIPDELWKNVESALKKKKKKIDNFDVVLKLYYNLDGEEVEFQPDVYKKVFGKGDWFFGNILGATTYYAKMILVNQKTGKEFEQPIMVSNDFYVPYKPNEVVLLPVDEGRIYAYWHLNRKEVWEDLVENHGANPNNIKYYVKVFHDYAGGIHHHQHLDQEFHMDFADNYYINAESDKIYRVQIVAVVDGWDVVELTPVSNSVQTGRTYTGNNAVSYADYIQPTDHPTNRPILSRGNTAQYSIGKLIFHLHAHLPFVGSRINYGTSGYWRPGGYIEEWYHEAMRETYVPLIQTFESLEYEGVDFKLSMDISPTLSNMMRDPVLQEEFLKYMDSLIALAKTEIERTSRHEPWYTYTAQMHLRQFRAVKSLFLKYDRDLTKAFKHFQDTGKLEICTCGATHGFLPLMGSKNIEAIRGQIKTAVIDYEQAFGRKPYGIWLPECAYTGGIEKVLEEFGIRYFFTETHTLLQSDCPVEFGVNAPAYIKGSKVAIFARDPETGKQVWSGDEGYPGDADYLEFHMRGGPLKYNRITDRKGNWKQPYVPEWAEAKASSHAQHFMENRNFRFEYIHHWYWKKPVVVATYDAELFGHHWYEGPRFLYYVFKKMYYDQNQTEMTTPSHYLAENCYNQEVYPTTSSWGDKGTFDKWMYGSVSWMYRHMNDACSEMINLVTWANEQGLQEKGPEDPGVRMLSQMARYLLISQNSDHGFNMSNGHFVDRIKELFFDDLKNFWELCNMFVKYMNDGSYNEVLLKKLERHLTIFPVIDPFVWSR